MGTGSVLAHKGSSANLIGAGQIVAKYKGPAANAEVIYLTFPKPIRAQFVVVQMRNIQNNIQLAEIRIIKCKFCL